MLRWMIVALAISAFVPPVEAGPLALKKASQSVTLGASGTACGAIGAAFDTRVEADGTFSSFAIPAGQVLVLDFLSWSTSSASPGTLRVFLDIDGVASAWVGVAGDQNSTEGGDSSALPNIVVRSGHTICISAPPGDSIVAPRLHGFLAKDS